MKLRKFKKIIYEVVGEQRIDQCFAFTIRNGISFLKTKTHKIK